MGEDGRERKGRGRIGKGSGVVRTGGEGRAGERTGGEGRGVEGSVIYTTLFTFRQN